MRSYHKKKKKTKQNTKNRSDDGVAQVLESLHSKCETLSLSPSTAKEKRKVGRS
jgi:hypothetical protein